MLCMRIELDCNHTVLRSLSSGIYDCDTTSVLELTKHRFNCIVHLVQHHCMHNNSSTDSLTHNHYKNFPFQDKIHTHTCQIWAQLPIGSYYNEYVPGTCVRIHHVMSCDDNKTHAGPTSIRTIAQNKRSPHSAIHNTIMDPL